MKRIIAGLLAVVLLLAVACAPPAPPAPAPPTPAPPAPPVAPNVVKVFIKTAISGPAGMYGPPQIEAWQDYFAYAKEEGLIPEGIKLEVGYEDTKYEVAKEVAIYRKVRVDPDIVWATTIQSGAGEALKDMYVADKVIHTHITSTSRHAVYPFDGYNFSPATLYNEENKALMHWLKENHWKEDRPAKVGISVWDTATGHAWAEGFEVGARENGWEVIEIDKFPYPGLPDFTPILKRFEAAGVDYYCLGAHVPTGVAFSRDLEKTGLLGKVTILVNSPIADESLIALGKEKVEGMIGTASRALWDAVDVPGVKLMHELRDKYRVGKPPAQLQMHVHAMGSAMVMLEAVRLAAADVGAANVGRENLAKYLMKVKDFDTGVIGKVTITAGDPRLGKETQVVQVQGGKLVSLSGWIPVAPWKATEWDWK